jgi:hypothetical protein
VIGQAFQFERDATDRPGASTDIHILKNGLSLFDDTIVGKTDTSAFNSTLQLAAGDNLDFAVGWYTYADGWDLTGLNLSITAVPEPSVLSLAMLGLICLRRKAFKQ